MTSEAYGTAYQNGFRLTVRLLLSRGIGKASALEFAQAAWVRGWEMLAQLRDENLVTSWVNSIALNFHRKWLRQQAYLLTLTDLPSGDVPNLAAIDVQKILDLLKPDDRILLQRRMEGVSIGEIAKDHRVTETAIRLRLLRARRTARNQIVKNPNVRFARSAVAA